MSGGTLAGKRAPRGRCPHPGGTWWTTDPPWTHGGPPTDRHYWGSLPCKQAPTAITAPSYWGHRVVDEVPKLLGYSHLLLGNSVARGWKRSTETAGALLPGGAGGLVK